VIQAAQRLSDVSARETDERRRAFSYVEAIERNEAGERF
jgi:hypothetical protein